jgi:hypothetical protein
MRTSVRCSVFMVALFAVTVIGAGAASASPWGVGLGAGSYGMARSGSVPGAAPASPTSACVTLTTTVKVSWTAVSGPSNGNPGISYTVYESTTSGTSGFNIVATGVSGSSWTSPSLTTGSYWFEVAAVYGSNWYGPISSSTGPRTITLVLCT